VAVLCGDQDVRAFVGSAALAHLVEGIAVPQDLPVEHPQLETEQYRKAHGADGGSHLRPFYAHSKSLCRDGDPAPDSAQEQRRTGAALFPSRVRRRARLHPKKQPQGCSLQESKRRKAGIFPPNSEISDGLCHHYELDFCGVHPS
jgi:hypothetical protein